jgi:hypothetical protein
MKLQLKAKHFKGTDFYDPEHGCAIDKAARELTGKYTRAGVDIVRIADVYHSLNMRYDNDVFNKDKAKAKKLHYSNKVIRTLKLT